MDTFELRGNFVDKLRITKAMAEKAAREFKRCETYVSKFPIFYKVWINSWFSDVSQGKYSFEVYLPNGRLIASVKISYDGSKVSVVNKVEGYEYKLHSQWKLALKQALKKEKII